MSWLQLILESDGGYIDEIVEFLEQFDTQSISLEACSEEPIITEGITTSIELWHRTRLTAVLHPDTDLDVLLVCLRNQIGPDKIYNHRIQLLKDQDWMKNFRDSHGPLLFDDRFCICPTWSEPPAWCEQVIVLDPGLAFGTGTHTTTSLCIEKLLQHDLEDKSVIDYGCGSGILALTALSLGAARAYAIDIDPLAIEATRKNAALNGIKADRLIIAHPDEISLKPVDVLVANILLGPLKQLSSRFTDYVTQNGIILLSGIMQQQADECLACYRSCFNMFEPVYANEWVLLEGERI